MKIVFIIGTRPEYIKVVPVFKVFRQDPLWEPILVSSGQHSSMLTQLYSFFDIKPDYDLKVMTKDQTLKSLSNKLMDQTYDLFEKIKPDYVFVQGDTTTTFIASLTAYYFKIPVLHLEAGLRTHNKYGPFPEEVNRRLTSVLADYHFCPTSLALKNLHNENITENTFLIGNTVVDSVLWAKTKVKANIDSYDARFKYLKSFSGLILITAHRRESFDYGLKGIAQAVNKLAKEYENFAFIIPVHLNPNVEQIFNSELAKLNNVFLLPPQNYDDIVYLMNSSILIMTDSGGIQEEAPSLNKPVLVLRDESERMESIEAGLSVLCGSNPTQIIKHFSNIIKNENVYKGMTNKPSPYGDGNSATKIKEIMDSINHN